jgi:hypothetical protein
MMIGFIAIRAGRSFNCGCGLCASIGAHTWHCGLIEISAMTPGAHGRVNGTHVNESYFALVALPDFETDPRQVSSKFIIPKSQWNDFESEITRIGPLGSRP